ncbi:cupin domain-containing protein [Campylobacter sp. MIT 99-7217]|uniref:cupin domain-containing protein n=1 Tax=Campylobacter sp. MIT 99-7217 TaxID=535091 RepID=UPI00115B9873|nr:cupin domain-containing protein [Campylobacter sp. MIT 99-7217]TQR33172.1 cupin domain-containing protein [Campylobacter sp. MIT 99-7217]
MQELIQKGTLGGFKGDSKIFSGEVSVDMAFKANEWRDFSGGLVRFSPKARSAWHTHPKGQTLLVLEGAIITGTETGQVQVAKKGDVISCPPNLKHWHGALDDEAGMHLALTSEIDGKNVTWLKKVSDKEYNKALIRAKNQN